MPATTERRVLCDTNTLARFVNAHDAQHPAVVHAVSLLQEARFVLFYAPQSLREFWNFATRRRTTNGFDLSVHETDHLTRQIESVFTLLPDTDAMHALWRRLVVEHEVRGVQVHDARLAASALAGGCQAILTLNDPDFKRFGVSAIHPARLTAYLANGSE